VIACAITLAPRTMTRRGANEDKAQAPPRAEYADYFTTSEPTLQMAAS
jgi:hypothetical protein